MNHQITEIKGLLAKYRSNTATSQEIERLFKLMASNDNTAEMKQLLQQELLDTAPADDDENNWDDVFEQIKTNIAAKERPRPQISHLKWWLAAASVALILSAALLFNKQDKQQPQLTAKKPVADVKPGAHKATLILANGKEIALTDGMTDTIAKGNNMAVVVDNKQGIHYNSTEVETTGENKLVTGKGEQSPYYLQLPDGTKAWLNAASSISFPTAFSGKNRLVKITGEVYFDVVHNQRQPFQVKAGNQIIEDIGTSFNINAYADEADVRTTLIEGSASVSNGSRNIVLRPGQQAAGNSNEINVKTADLAEITAWRKGLFKFKDADLKIVMRQISRWYNVAVQYQGNIPSRKFSGEVTRNLKLSEMLDVLSYFQVDFEIKNEKNGNLIIVKP